MTESKVKAEKPKPEYVYEKHSPENFTKLNQRRQIEALLFKAVELETRLALLEADKVQKDSNLIILPGKQ